MVVRVCGYSSDSVVLFLTHRASLLCTQVIQSCTFQFWFARCWFGVFSSPLLLAAAIRHKKQQHLVLVICPQDLFSNVCICFHLLSLFAPFQFCLCKAIYLYNGRVRNKYTHRYIPIRKKFKHINSNIRRISMLCRNFQQKKYVWIKN